MTIDEAIADLTSRIAAASPSAVVRVKPRSAAEAAIRGYAPADEEAAVKEATQATTLSLLPPNVVGMVNTLEKRGLIERQPHPVDGRALGLHLTPEGEALVTEAESTVEHLEIEATSSLTATERKTLIRLLQKIYRT